MSVVHLSDLEDPRLDAYRDIRHRNWTYVSRRFIAEGRLLVECLLASTYQTESVLLDAKYAEGLLPTIPDDVAVLLLDHVQIEQLVGFNFHRGILACGVRPKQLELPRDFGDAPQATETLLAAVGVQDSENLGSILRACAAFGVQRVIIGPGTTDPLCRRVLRVSMGNALRLRLLHSTDMLSDLDWLRCQHAVTSFATSLSDESRPLEQMTRSGPILILVGNERYGLPQNTQAACDARVRIDMQLGTDSLNVGQATAIFIHYFARLAADMRAS